MFYYTLPTSHYSKISGENKYVWGIFWEVYSWKTKTIFNSHVHWFHSLTSHITNFLSPPLWNILIYLFTHYFFIYNYMSIILLCYMSILCYIFIFALWRKSPSISLYMYNKKAFIQAVTHVLCLARNPAFIPSNLDITFKFWSCIFSYWGLLDYCGLCLLFTVTREVKIVKARLLQIPASKGLCKEISARHLKALVLIWFQLASCSLNFLYSRYLAIHHSNWIWSN